MFEIIHSEEINHRIDFALLCNARNARIAIEVGTDLGWFAARFMERFEGEMLVCVDAYESFEEFPWPRTMDQLTAVQALLPWHGRVRFLQARSTEAATKLPWWMADRCDFVYIDASHDYESVKADLEAWWPVVTAQGILAGHDYDSTHPGVMRAVNEFAQEHDVIVRIVQGDHLPSWYIYKNEPEELYHCFFNAGTSPNARFRPAERP